MSDTNPSSLQESHTSESDESPGTGRLSNWRPKVRWFFAEILIVVAGVLIALALNAWWQGQQDAASEQNYLEQLNRDLGQMIENLEELSAYEEGQFQHGVNAYRVLSAETRTNDDETSAGRSLSRLLSRRTVYATKSTYEDLLNTGNLQLIRNPKLRNRLMSFYEEAERQFEIHNKNNEIFVDDLFADLLLRNGYIYVQTPSVLSHRAAVDSILSAALKGGYAEGSDPLWSLPATADDWDKLRTVLLQRIKVSAYAKSFADSILEEIRGLQETINAELDR